MRLKLFLVFLAGALITCSFSVPPKADNVYNAEYGDIVLNYVDSNPIKFSFQGGENGTFQAQLVTENHETQTYLKTEGGFDLSQTVKVNRDKIIAKLKDEGKINYRFAGSNQILVVTGKGEAEIIASPDMGGLSYESKNVKTTIKVEADKGLLRVNNDTSLGLPTDEERIQKSLGVTKRRAKELITEHGTQTLLNGLDLAGQLGSRNGENLLEATQGERDNQAGGAGAVIAAGGSVSVNTLDAATIFRLFLDKPRVTGRLRSSSFQMRIRDKVSGTSLKGLNATITISGPVNGDNPEPNHVVLMDNVTYSEEKGNYHYEIDKEDFLVSPSRLEPGGYDLYVDVGKLGGFKLGVTINEKLEVFSGRY